jgi:SAM-dependent methyltransferase
MIHNRRAFASTNPLRAPNTHMHTNHHSHYPGAELDAMSEARNYNRWILDHFVPYLGQRVAEVGAGIGTISELLLAQGVTQLVSYEPSKNMFPMLAEKLRHDDRARAVNDVLRPNDAADRFDSVIYVNVLEHIEDDRAELATAHAALKPNGHVMIFVPALSWLYSDFDRQIGHFRRYTKNGLKDLAKDVGFTTVKAHYFDLLGILPWYVMFVLLRKVPVRGNVMLYDKLVVPPLKRIEGMVKPPIGKSVLFVGTKL